MKAIIPTDLKKRTSDQWGAGWFGAPRGTRTHNGIDYMCPPQSQVLAPCDGKITKLGYPYADDLSFRYVQITDKDGKDHRVFYVEPILPMGRELKKDTVIGYSQELGERYEGITEHIHYEIKLNGEYLDPEGE